MQQNERSRAAEPRDPAVQMRDVRKVFDDVVAVDSIDLTIDSGEIVGIIGPSGSGKTTVIRMMLGIYAPTRGVVRVLGRDPAHFRRVDRERIGYLPQHFVLYPDLTVRENLAFIAGSYGLGWFRRRRRIADLLNLVNLTDAKDRLAQNISGGMQRRLELAAALVNDPQLIVLDEPTAGLDPVLRADIWETFRGMREGGRTLVVTTQYVTEAEYCDRVQLIDKGRVVAFGTPEELRRMAYGGDVVRLTVPDLDRDLAREISSHPFVISSERTGEDGLLLVVEDARQAIATLTEWLVESGRPLSSIEEYRQPFDDVFVRLVERAGGSEQSERKERAA